ncbi:MAG TPA: biotin transporter BioY [Clostridia bacterium]|nr:biotin transporter BioY [Clostridia bacterium]
MNETGAKSVVRGKVKRMALTALCAALIAVGAFIRVPVPGIPFTLQTFFVTLAGLTLGANLGACSALLYLAVGLVGFPVFAGGGGPGYVLQPSFGYLVGFVLGAYLTGKIAHAVPEPSFGRSFAAAFAGLGVVYACGMAYFAALKALYFAEPVVFTNILIYCFLIFLPGDAALSAVAVLSARRLRPVVERG